MWLLFLSRHQCEFVELFPDVPGRDAACRDTSARGTSGREIVDPLGSTVYVVLLAGRLTSLANSRVILAGPPTTSTFFRAAAAASASACITSPYFGGPSGSSFSDTAFRGVIISSSLCVADVLPKEFTLGGLWTNGRLVLDAVCRCCGTNGEGTVGAVPVPGRDRGP